MISPDSQENVVVTVHEKAEVSFNAISASAYTTLLTLLSFLAADGILIYTHEGSHKLLTELQGFDAQMEVYGSFPNTLLLLHRLGLDVQPFFLAMMDGETSLGKSTWNEVDFANATDWQRLAVTGAPYLLEAVIIAVTAGFIVDQFYRASKKEGGKEKLRAATQWTLPAIAAATPFYLDAYHNFSDALDGLYNDIARMAYVLSDYSFDYRLLIPKLAEQYWMFVFVLTSLAAILTFAGHVYADRKESSLDSEELDEQSEQE